MMVGFENTLNLAGSAYFQLFTYLLVPGFLIEGLLIISIEMYIQRRKDKKADKKSEKQKLVIEVI